MKWPIFVLCVGLLIAALSVPASGIPGPGGNCLTLDVKPDTPVGGGDVVHITLSGGREDDHAVLFAGHDLGSYSIGGWTLDLIPDAMQHLGTFPVSGSINIDLTLPNPIPPALAGTTQHVQGASVGRGCCHGGELKWHESNLDLVELLH